MSQEMKLFYFFQRGVVGGMNVEHRTLNIERRMEEN
jgi:hypothetical protein